VRGSRSVRGEIVSRFVLAVPAVHRADAVAVGAANDVRDVRAPRIALKRRLGLVAIQASRMLENRGDLGSRGEAFGPRGQRGRFRLGPFRSHSCREQNRWQQEAASGICLFGREAEDST
jgi:hypothetical protein